MRFAPSVFVLIFGLSSFACTASTAPSNTESGVKPGDATPDEGEKTPTKDEATPTEPAVAPVEAEPPPLAPAEPQDGVTPVADGSKGLTLELVAGDPPISVTLSPPVGYGNWMAQLSSHKEPTDLDLLCGAGSAEYGVFAGVHGIAATGYSRVLASKVVIFSVGLTYDDTGHYEEDTPGVLFWRDSRLVCWTEENTKHEDWVALGLFDE